MPPFIRLQNVLILTATVLLSGCALVGGSDDTLGKTQTGQDDEQSATEMTIIPETRPASIVPGPYFAPSLYVKTSPRHFINADGTYDCVLSFDDGPHHRLEPKIYDILDTKGVKAVFFFLGRNIKANPQTTKTAFMRGHEVGYHSWDHKDMSNETIETVENDFRMGIDVLHNLGLSPMFFRPPYGKYDAQLVYVAAQNGMSVINWSNDSRDWVHTSPQDITSEVVNNSRPGEIILLHSIHTRTIEALPDIIDGLRDKGCRFTTMQAWVDRATTLLPAPITPVQTTDSEPDPDQDHIDAHSENHAEDEALVEDEAPVTVSTENTEDAQNNDTVAP